VQQDIKTHRATGNKCLSGLYRVIKSCNISTAAKVKIYSTFIRPVVLYKRECCTVSEYWKDQLGVWESKVLIKIFGPVKERGRWRIRKNAELEWCYKTTSIVTTIRTWRLGWVGHVQ
jgi:hypothetical protein